MPKVFIPNRSTHDFSAATEFGDLVFLSTGNQSRYNTSKTYRSFWPVLRNSTSEDFLLITGLTVLNIVAAFILVQKHGRLNLLLFKTHENNKSYIERILMGEEGEKL